MVSSVPENKSRQVVNGEVMFVDSAAASLLRERIPELLDPEKHGWERVKHNVSRTVYRGKIDGEGIYVKHYHSRSPVHRLVRKLGCFDSRREMRFSQYLNSRGVPAVPVLGAMCRGDVEWLATREVGPAEPGDVWHERQLARGSDGKRAIQRTIAVLGTMLGRMHTAGVLHRDLHCGNILVRTNTDEPDLVLTDLHRGKHRNRLSRRSKAVNLAQLFHDRCDFTTRTERLRFLKHYIKASGGTGTLRGWVILIEQFAHRHTRRQRAQRDRRILGYNPYFTPLKLGGGWSGHAVLRSKRRMGGARAAELVFTEDDWCRTLVNPPDLFRSPDGDVVKDSRSSLVVRRSLQIGPHSVEVFVKRARRKQAWKLLANCFRAARSIRAFKLGHTLLTRRIATALPLVALERRLGPILLDSILITEAVEGPNLSNFLNTWLAGSLDVEQPLTPAQQRHLARQVLWGLGRLVRKLHDNNLAHRDLKASNMLIHWSPQNPPEIVLVDLDGLRRKRLLTLRRKFQGLMRLNVSLLKCPVVNRAGRLRMLLGYLRRPGSGRINYKSYWRVLEDWSSKKLKNQIRSQRKRQRAARRPVS